MFFKKKESNGVSADKIEENGIYVLGSGCAKCDALEANVKKALENLGSDEEPKHVRDFAVIASYGVMSTPALVVDNKVVSYGKVLDVDSCQELIAKAREC